MGVHCVIGGEKIPYSEDQRIAAAIAKHHPSKLYKRNRGMLKMSNKQLHEFSTGLAGAAKMARKKKHKPSKNGGKK